MQTHHIALKVLDLKKCEDFYSKVLGLKVIARHKRPDGLERSIWFDLDGTILMLELAEETAGWELVALKIDCASRKKWKDKLKAADVKINDESQHSIYFVDPENNRLSLSHFPDVP